VVGLILDKFDFGLGRSNSYFGYVIHRLRQHLADFPTGSIFNLLSLVDGMGVRLFDEGVFSPTRTSPKLKHDLPSPQSNLSKIRLATLTNFQLQASRNGVKRSTLWVQGDADLGPLL
jgi:hypothetical protein